jgi:hypothetical protein
MTLPGVFNSDALLDAIAAVEERSGQKNGLLDAIAAVEERSGQKNGATIEALGIPIPLWVSMVEGSIAEVERGIAKRRLEILANGANPAVQFRFNLFAIAFKIGKEYGERVA